MDREKHTYPFDFSRTFDHPLARRGLVEMVPTDFLFDISSRSTSGMTDLPGTSALIKLPFLWRHMKRNGMMDPLIIGVGAFTGDCRLEAGNHRIQLFRRAGIKEVPAVVLLGDDCITHVGNGMHRFKHPLKNNIYRSYETRPYSETVYCKPSDVFLHYDREAGTEGSRNIL